VEAHFGCGLRRHAASGPIGGRYDRALSGGVLSGAASSRPQGKRMASALGGDSVNITLALSLIIAASGAGMMFIYVWAALKLSGDMR
jgi:hypothetical protein